MKRKFGRPYVNGFVMASADIFCTLKMDSSSITSCHAKQLIVIEKKAFVAFRLIRDHHKIIPEKVYTPKRKKKKSFQSS